MDIRREEESVKDPNGDEAHTPPQHSTKPHGLSMATELESEPDHNDTRDDNRQLRETSVTMDISGSCSAEAQDGSSSSKATHASSRAALVSTSVTDPEPRVEDNTSQANDGVGVYENVVEKDGLGEGSAPGATAAVAAAAASETGTATTAGADAEEKIQGLLSTIPLDSEKLRNIAWEAGGYQTNDLRGIAWAELLNIDRRRDLEDFRGHLETPHAMADQIQRDIDRSLTHFEHVRGWKRERQQSKREKLRDVINAIIRKYDGVLNYYQGYHDVVTTLLLVTGDDRLSHALAERVSLYFFRDCMREDFGVLIYLMHLVPVVIQEFDPELASFISKSKVEPYYCMPWVLTWFAHDLSDFQVVARLYDVLLGGHPTLVLYLCAAVTMSARRDVLACDCEFSAVHNTLARAAKRVTDWEAVLKRTNGIFLKCPPRDLVLRAPAYIRETLSAGGVNSLEYPPPWFTGISLPDWVSLEHRREKEGKRRIAKAAWKWHRTASLAVGENPQDMLAAYLEEGSGSMLKEALYRVMSRVRLRGLQKWKIAPSPTAALISTAVVMIAVSYSYLLSSRQQIGM